MGARDVSGWEARPRCYSESWGAGRRRALPEECPGARGGGAMEGLEGERGAGAGRAAGAGPGQLRGPGRWY